MTRVALIGNMNNNHFPLLRYLLDRGYEAELLLLDSEFEHFQPEYDTFQILDLPILKTNFSKLPSGFWRLKKNEIRSILSKYDFLIGAGPAPAICSVANISLDLFTPYGSDIYYIPFSRWIFKIGLKKALKTRYLRWHQRRGIKRCKSVMMDFTNDEYELLFESLGVNNKRIYSNLPFIYHYEYSPLQILKHLPKSSLYNKLKSIRDTNDVLIFHHCRHEWIEDEKIVISSTKHTKGNQKLIKAFAQIVKQYPQKKLQLITFEYGSDVDRSKKLIHDLGIESNVTWFPLAPRREIMIGISLCDLGVGELDSSYFSYGTIYEFLAMSKPVIHYRDDKQYSDYYESMYPMYSAKNTNNVREILERYIDDPSAFRETGRIAHNWFLENAIERPLRLIIDKIDAKCAASSSK